MSILKLRETTVHRAFVYTALIAALANWTAIKMDKMFENSRLEVAIFFASNMMVLYALRYLFGYGDSMRI